MAQEDWDKEVTDGDGWSRARLSSNAALGVFEFQETQQKSAHPVLHSKFPFKGKP